MSFWASLIASWLVVGVATAHASGPSQDTQAVAPEIEVRSPRLATRAEATAVARLARAAGVRPKVRRRYEHSAGWSWVVQVPRLASVDQARDLAQSLAHDTGFGFVVLGGQPHSSPPVRDSATGPSPDVAAVDDAVVSLARRRNVPADAIQLLEQADAVTFRYVRTLSDGTRVIHTYARHDGRTYLRFAPEGDHVGEAATYLLSDGHAWASRGDAPLTPTDFYRTRDTVERFAPERVLQPALSAGAGLSAARDGEDSRTLPDGTVRLQVGSPGRELATALHIDARTARVVRLEVPGPHDGIVHELSGDAVGVLKVAREQITRRGTTVLDRVEVLDLSLGAPQELAWFLAPQAGPI